MNKLVFGVVFIVGLGIGYIIPRVDSTHLQDEMMWSQSSQFSVMFRYIRIPLKEKESFDHEFNSYLQKQAGLFLNYSNKTGDDALADRLVKHVEIIDEYLSVIDD